MSLKRLRTWDFRIQAHTTDRSLLQASKEPDALKDKLRLPDAIIEKAAHIFRKAQQRGLTKGRTIPGLLAAVVYAACRETGIPRTLKDIATASNIERKHVSKAYR